MKQSYILLFLGILTTSVKAMDRSPYTPVSVSQITLTKGTPVTPRGFNLFATPVAHSNQIHFPINDNSPATPASFDLFTTAPAERHTVQVRQPAAAPRQRAFQVYESPEAAYTAIVAGPAQSTRIAGSPAAPRDFSFFVPRGAVKDAPYKEFVRTLTHFTTQRENLFRNQLGVTNFLQSSDVVAAARQCRLDEVYDSEGNPTTIAGLLVLAALIEINNADVLKSLVANPLQQQIPCSTKSYNRSPVKTTLTLEAFLRQSPSSVSANGEAGFLLPTAYQINRNRLELSRQLEIVQNTKIISLR